MKAASSPPRIIMGIDPGTIITGYGLIKCQGKKMEMLACGSLQLGKSKEDHPTRLKRLFARVSSLIEEFQPQEVALEAPFYGKNPQSMLKLGRAQGVAMAAALTFDLPVFEYAPRKVKMAITGRGASSKEQVALMLQKLLKFEEFPHLLDATDGLAVAVCHFFQGKLASEGKRHKNWASFLKDHPDRIKKP
ncbi:MAG: crossover junction endodeoxyribonuclease RuvC [Bacteroidota bacterium]